MSKTEHTGDWMLLALGVLLAALLILSFRPGWYRVDAGTTCRILLSYLLPLEQMWTDNEYTTVLSIRLPRIALTCLVGCYLSSAGAIYQRVFQNPMASPDMLGASSSASFRTALAILAGLSNQGTALSAFFWSLVMVALAYLVGQRAPKNRVLNLVLTGMAISPLFAAATSYLKLVTDSTSQLSGITYWLMGSLSGTQLAGVTRILLAMTAELLPLSLPRWRLNLFTLEDGEARAMGMNAPRLHFLTVVCAALITAASIVISGMIDWVGLVVPYPRRKLVGSNFKVSLPCFILTGAAFLLLMDNLSRNLPATEIPIDTLTTLTGMPFFLYLILREGGAR